MEDSTVEQKDAHDEIGLLAGRHPNGTPMAGVVFVQHGMTEDLKPVVFLSPGEAEMLALNLVRLAHDLRRGGQRETDRG